MRSRRPPGNRGSPRSDARRRSGRREASVGWPAVEARAQSLYFASSEFQREGALGTGGNGSRLALEQIHFLERPDGRARAQVRRRGAAVGLVQAEDQGVLVLRPLDGLGHDASLL